MKKRILILAVFLGAITDSIAQEIPYGLYVDIDGKVKFWRYRNSCGTNEDTVYMTFNGQTNLTYLSNLKFIHLTILRSPRSHDYSGSSGGPIFNKDATFQRKLDSLKLTKFNFDSNPMFLSLAIQNHETSPVIHAKELFYDDFRSDELTDSLMKLIRIESIDFIDQFYGQVFTEDELKQLQDGNSNPDPMIEYRAAYGNLVHTILICNYDKKERLTKVFVDHSDAALEVDSMKYDKSGNLIYFSREDVGWDRNEFFFNYDKFGRVIAVTKNYSSINNENSIDTSFSHEIKYTYDNMGIMNSIARLREGKWLTYYIEIK